MEELLKEMMEHGLLIYRNLPGTNFVLKKIPTPANSKVFIKHSDTSMEFFDTYEEALTESKAFLGWKDPEPEVEAGCWQGTLMYQHALGPRFEDLGTTEAADYQEAMIYFNRTAESFICEYGEELGIGDSEVRVRPCPQ